MKLLFTRLQEDNSIVKRSVTQLRVETGSGSETPDFPAITLYPESRVAEKGIDARPLRVPLNDGAKRLALRGNAENRPDTVDLQGLKGRDRLQPLGYSSRGREGTGLCLTEREGKVFGIPVDDSAEDRGFVCSQSENREVFSLTEEKQARYQFVARKFIAVQNIIEYDHRKEKTKSFELII